MLLDLSLCNKNKYLCFDNLTFADNLKFVLVKYKFKFPL